MPIVRKKPESGKSKNSRNAPEPASFPLTFGFIASDLQLEKYEIRTIFILLKIPYRFNGYSNEVDPAVYRQWKPVLKDYRQLKIEKTRTALYEEVAAP